MTKKILGIGALILVVAVVAFTLGTMLGPTFSAQLGYTNTPPIGWMMRSGAHPGGMRGFPMMDGFNSPMNFGWGGMAFFGIARLAWWGLEIGLIAAVVYWLVKRNQAKSATPAAPPPPTEASTPNAS